MLKLVSDADRSLREEAQHVRMRYAHHAHVGAATHTTLLNHVSHLIDDVHERDGPEATPPSIRRALQKAAGIHRSSRSTAGLMNRRRSLGMIHNAGNRVRHIQHKAGSKLAVCFAGVNQARRVGNKLARQHTSLMALKNKSRSHVFFRSRNMTHHAANDIRPLFQRTSLRVFQRVALADYALAFSPSGWVLRRVVRTDWSLEIRLLWGCLLWLRSFCSAFLVPG